MVAVSKRLNAWICPAGEPVDPHQLPDVLGGAARLQSVL